MSAEGERGGGEGESQGTEEGGREEKGVEEGD